MTTASTEYNFTFNRKIKPYVRMTKRGKWVKPEAREYLESQAAIAWDYRAQMLEHGWEMLPTQTPLAVRILVVAPEQLHKNDSDNLIKALQDAAQGVVFKNDMWVDEIQFARRLGEAYRATVSIGVLENASNE